MHITILFVLVFTLAGCSTTPAGSCAPTTIEIPVVERVPVPGACLAPCEDPAGEPATNGQLLERDAARGLALACYRARLQCVVETGR